MSSATTKMHTKKLNSRKEHDSEICHNEVYCVNMLGLLKWTNFSLRWLVSLFLKKWFFLKRWFISPQTISTNSKTKDSKTGFAMPQKAYESKLQKVPENQVSLAGSKIIHINTKAVFAQAASVAKKGLPSHTVTRHALPSSLANTGMLIEKARSREVPLIWRWGWRRYFP